MASKELREFMEHQTQNNWCWAACGASVGNYYWGPSRYTQCGIANTCQSKTTCCTDPAGCNQYGYLNLALEAARSFRSSSGGTSPYSSLKGEVDKCRPVGTRVAWTGGGAHFMMVTGYNDDGDKITIQDPWYGTSRIAYASYPASYQGGGSWTHTYLTQRQ